MKHKYGMISARIKEYVAKHPNAKPKEVAAAVKCKVSNVYALRYKKAEPVKAKPVKAEPVKAEGNAVFTAGAATAFLISVLTREELVGAYKTFSTLSTASIDVVNTNAYAEWLREVLSSR